MPFILSNQNEIYCIGVFHVKRLYFHKISQNFHEITIQKIINYLGKITKNKWDKLVCQNQSQNIYHCTIKKYANELKT